MDMLPMIPAVFAVGTMNGLDEKIPIYRSKTACLLSTNQKNYGRAENPSAFIIPIKR